MEPTNEKHPILRALEQASQSGHSYMRTATLLTRCHAINEESFCHELQRLADAGSIRLDGDAVYLAETWEDEDYVARRLADYLQGKPRRIFKPLTVQPAASGVFLNPAQRRAVELATGHDLSLIVGCAGRGKSATASALIGALAVDPQNELVLCAPTGKAARNLCDATGYAAGTLHHSLHLLHSGGAQQPDALDGKKLVIVDEAGMIPLHVFAELLRAAPDDCRIVLLGDCNQLQGIGAGNILPDLLNVGVPCQTLSTVYRQQSQASALYANVTGFSSARNAADFRTDDSFQFVFGTDEKIREMLVNDAVRLYRMGEDVAIITPRRSGVPLGTAELNLLVRERLRPMHAGMRMLQSGGLELWDRDRVIVTQNSAFRGCFNGDVGTLRVRDGRYDVLFPCGSASWTDEELARRRIPLELAYALTVHRAQGSGYGTVLIPLSLEQMGNMLQRNLLYTAITRAKQRVILYCTDGALDRAIQTSPPYRRSRLVERTRAHVRETGAA